METQSLYPRFRYYYRTLVPIFEKPQLIAYVLLSLSFFTMAFFGIFAIRPTLATIAQLRKRIEDQRVVNTRMEEKINQLRVADVAYQNIRPDLDAIFEALPNTPQAATLLGKLNRTLIENNIDIIILQFSQIPLRSPTASASASSIGFSLTGKASYEDMLTFIDLLFRTDRVITIDSLDISPTVLSNQSFIGFPSITSDILTILIAGKSYVLPEGSGREGG